MLPLKIGILVFTALDKNVDESSLMLKNTALSRGHKARFYRNANFQFTFDCAQPRLFYKNANFNPPDVMIIRPGIQKNVDLEVSSVKQLQLMDIPVVNHYLPIVRAKNKVRTMQILNHHGIPLPRTEIVHNLENIDAAVARIGRFPVIMKVPEGARGMGVSIVESNRSLKSMLDLLVAGSKNSFIIIQEYVKEAKGKDIRVFIVDGKIVAAMERRAKRGDFRSNLYQGGTSVAFMDLTEEEKAMAIHATKVIGLDVAGVDVIRTSEGPKILEVNSNPGLEGITEATGINVAEEIVKFAEKSARQRKWLINKEESLIVAA